MFIVHTAIPRAQLSCSQHFLLPVLLFFVLVPGQTVSLGAREGLSHVLMRMPHCGTLTRSFDVFTLYLNAAEMILAVLLEAQEASEEDRCDAHRVTPVGTLSWQIQRHTLKMEAYPVVESGWGQPRRLSIIASS